MVENIILYGDITLAGFENLEIKKLTVTQQVNEHAKLNLYARLKNEDEKNYLEEFRLNRALQFTQNGKPIFVGVMLNFEVIAVQNVRYINVDAVSLTYLMDIDIKSRSFQDTEMAYTDILDEITDNSVYPKASYIDTVSEGATIDRPIIQYLETDWQYAKRLASHFNSVLVPSVRMDAPSFFFGIPKFGEDVIEVHNFKNIKDYDKYKILSTEIPSITTLDCTAFEAEVYKIYELGERVNVNGVPTNIGKTTYSYENSVIGNICTFNIKKGLSTIHVPNLNIAGSSIFGKVIDVARDHVKVHLDIDEEQPIGEAFWYRYATMYASQGEVGWYCMPELGDIVRLYHPNGDEGEATFINSIKPHPNDVVENLPSNHRMADPDIKYLRTAKGKELKLRPNGIDIIAKDNTVYACFNDDGTLYLNSNDKISMTAVNDIEMKAKNINLEAEEMIELKSKAGTITMVEDIEVEGEEVKTN